MIPKNITIIGVGLLGGSIGLGLRANSCNSRITGYGHRRQSLERAVEFNAIDRYSLDLADAVQDADLVILCTPVGLFAPILQELAPLLKPGVIITDVGSTKRSVVRLAAELLPDNVHFVGSHPMAGSEKRGVEYARADLFHGAMCILTPTAATDPKSLSLVEAFWHSLQMRLIRLSPEEHDAAVADISHLPHVLAAALLSMQAQSALPLSGKGFLDATRIASGDAALWRDIILDNRDNLKAGLDRLQKELASFRKLLSPAKAESLALWLQSAAQRRDQLLQRKLREMNPD